MTPDRYTELFFLDEATAFSAGHRPCAECRRKAFSRFKHFWLEANPNYGYNERTPIWKIDEVLHKERINRSGAKITFNESISHLPPGSFILYNNEPYLFADRLFFRWTSDGYEDGISLTGVDRVEVLTPRSVVNTFRAGYKPQIAVAVHPFP